MDKLNKASENIGKALNCLQEAKDELGALYDAAEYRELVNVMDTIDEIFGDIEDSMSSLETIDNDLERIDSTIREAEEALE